MLRIERSKEFWSKIMTDPSVTPVFSMDLDEFLACVENPKVTPLANEFGGYLLIDLSIGLITEFHTIFTDKGRGKEALQAGCELADIVFRSSDMAVTYETIDNSMSRPPLSFGFEQCPTVKTTPHGDMRLWFLTKSRWESSPVYRRIHK